MEKLKQQIAFILELDKLKSVLRRSYLTHNPRLDVRVRLNSLEASPTRRENSAEHSWHIALAALTLAEYANEPVEIGHVIKLLLVHDVVEIDAGDTFVYDTVANLDQHDRETVAAQRIFGMLPADQRDLYLGLWREFEEHTTPEAKFARAVDRLLPVLHNCYTQGRGWQENNITQGQVLGVNRIIEEGSADLWHFIQAEIQQAVDHGYLATRQS